MGGEHKCPLCSATFTRPQHVGRHLRAHTGDRPYECKECPLRFARSDLLSRHVNKAHPKPDGSGPDRKGDKRGRRKSMSSQNPSGITASRPPVVHPANVPPAPIACPPQPHPEHAAFQAQRMYPNHPLLQQDTGLWGQQFSLGHAHQYVPDLVMPNFSTGVSAVEVPRQTSFDPTLTHAAPPLGLDLAVKKRACDQCNHSKVRCDCADPCARCAHRSIRCSYTKTPRSRAHPGPLNTVAGGVANNHPMSAVSPTTSVLTSSPHSGQARMLPPDATLVDPNPTGAGALPLVPNPPWESGVTQKPGVVNNNNIVHQSPAVMNMSLPPTLTNSAPSSTEASTEQHGSAQSTSSTNGWILPPVVTPIEYGGIQTDAIGLASSFHGTGPLFRTRQDSTVSGLDSSSPNYAATASSEDDDSSSISWTDKDGEMARRRRSSAGQWASAIDQLHLDDNGIPFDASGLQFPFAPTSTGEPTRNATFPMDAGVAANLSRAPSSQDNFWKLFLDPAALASPDVGELAPIGGEMATPRGLSKSNSMPDLKTPPTASAHYAPLQFMDDPSSIPTAPPGGANDPTPGPPQQRANSDDTDMDRWRDLIQQRHASFSMNMSASTAARKVTTGQLNAATFASGNQRFFRPPPQPLIMGSAMQQTLAPERTPSFMSAFDPTTPKGNPRTPTAQLLNWYTNLERPSNKRMASQTLVPDMYQKRQQTYPPPTAPDELRSAMDSSTDSSPRRSSEMSRFNPSRTPIALSQASTASTSEDSPARP